jgi:arylsulfatase A-like enzyme
VAAKSRSAALLSGVDWFPTLMEMLKLDASPTHQFDGVSQVSALRGGDGLRSSFVGYLPHRFPLANTGPSTSVREGDWKLIRFHHDGPMQQDRFELYNLSADPGEMNDLSDTQPERVHAMDTQIPSRTLTINASQHCPCQRLRRILD